MKAHVCPPCSNDDHRNCLDGDAARDYAYGQSIRGDTPPLFGCLCPKWPCDPDAWDQGVVA